MKTKKKENGISGTTKIYKSLGSFNEKYLVCPRCYEFVARNDIEHFHNCPYCDHRFEMDCELEDYLLKPLIDRWVMRQSNISPEMSFGIIHDSDSPLLR